MTHHWGVLLLLLVATCLAAITDISKEDLEKQLGTSHEAIALKAYKSTHLKSFTSSPSLTSSLHRRGAPLGGPEALFDAQANLRSLFDLEPQFGESPCTQGFASAAEGICDGLVRTYPDVGGTKTFNAGTSYTLAYSSKLLNLWVDELTNVTAEAVELMELGMRLAENVDEIKDYVPKGPFGTGGKSALEALCAAQGAFPFHYTCSNKFNILLTECGFVNAFVDGFDIWGNDFGVRSDDSGQDNLVTFCQELIFQEPEPSTTANTIIHEISHGIQYGTGWTQNQVFMEGGATFAESGLLGLPSRTWTRGGSFPQWADIFDGHFLSRSGSWGRFYQIQQLFLSFLSSETRLGEKVLGLKQMTQFFSPPYFAPFGREIFDFFLQDGDFADFVVPAPQHGNLIASIADFWTAVYGRCSDRPIPDPKFNIPGTGQGWLINCASLGSVDSSEQFYETSYTLRWGSVFADRIDRPKSLTISPSVLDGTMLRVIAIPEDVDTPYEVFSVEADSTTDLCLSGSYSSVIIVTINVDPFGDLVNEADLPPGWHLSSAESVSGNSWYVGDEESQEYLANQARGLQTPSIDLPLGTSTFTFETLYDIEDFAPAPFNDTGCLISSWDGFFVRVFDSTGAAHYPTPIEDDYTGTLYASIESLLWDPLGTGDCPEGWASSTGDLWVTKTFDLSPFEGESVIVEILFLSDSGGSDRGVFVDNVMITGPSGQIFLDDGDDNVFLTQVNYGADESGIDASQVSEWQGRPAGFVPFDGNFADRLLLKNTFTKPANWSASWRGQRRANFAWVGSGDSLVADQITLYPGTEAVLKQEAPFDGRISTVSVLMGLSQAGIRGYRATIRSKRGSLLASETLLEPETYSNFGKTEPVQTFHFTSSPKFDCGDKFYLGFEPLFDDAALASRADYHPFGGFSTLACNLAAPELSGLRNSETGEIDLDDPFSGYSISISAAFSSDD